MGPCPLGFRWCPQTPPCDFRPLPGPAPEPHGQTASLPVEQGLSLAWGPRRGNPLGWTPASTANVGAKSRLKVGRQAPGPAGERPTPALRAASLCRAGQGRQGTGRSLWLPLRRGVGVPAPRQRGEGLQPPCTGSSLGRALSPRFPHAVRSHPHSPLALAPPLGPGNRSAKGLQTCPSSGWSKGWVGSLAIPDSGPHLRTHPSRAETRGFMPTPLACSLFNSRGSLWGSPCHHSRFSEEETEARGG